jgi:hypothetical protein
MDLDNLTQFDLVFPGSWIEDEDRDRASQVNRVLHMVQSLFIEAVTSYALFSPLVPEKNRNDYIERHLHESPYKRCLNSIYAKTFVFALYNIKSLLSKLANMHPPSEVKEFVKKYNDRFGHLKHIRDSATHIEDRGLGLNRDGKQISTNLLILGSFLERRFTFSGENGMQYEIEISDQTLSAAKEIIQAIINSYTWTGFGILTIDKMSQIV